MSPDIVIILALSVASGDYPDATSHCFDCAHFPAVVERYLGVQRHRCQDPQLNRMHCEELTRLQGGVSSTPVSESLHQEK